ncbi:hypothetical protein ACFFP0_23695 [Rhizobium puerariae]|uniref:Uncharacterized protein n=1 Tax=Rhizobium puerariae TaxID=1585791 RepID=A0ABV6ARC9_9HYPH
MRYDPYGRPGKQSIFYKQTPEEPAVDWPNRHDAEYFASIAVREFHIVLDRETLSYDRPRLYGTPVFKFNMGRAMNEADLQVALVPRGSDETYELNAPAQNNALASMRMMVRHKPGKFVWVRPEREKVDNLEFWIAKCGRENVFLKDPDGRFLTPDGYDRLHSSKYVRNAAEQAYTTFTERPARDDIPKVLVQINRDLFVSHEHFARIVHARHPFNHTRGFDEELRNRHVLILAMNGKSYFSAGTTRLNNPHHFHNIVVAHHLNPEIADRPPPHHGSVPAFLVRRDRHTFISGEAMRPVIAARGERLDQIVPEADIFARKGDSGGKAGNYTELPSFRGSQYNNLSQEQAAAITGNPGSGENPRPPGDAGRRRVRPLQPSVSYLVETNDLAALDGLHDLMMANANIPDHDAPSIPERFRDPSPADSLADRRETPRDTASWRAAVADKRDELDAYAVSRRPEDEFCSRSRLELEKTSPPTRRNLERLQRQLENETPGDTGQDRPGTLRAAQDHSAPRPPPVAGPHRPSGTEGATQRRNALVNQRPPERGR